MKLSIIVSVDNSEKYLENCINSILSNCTVKEYECILIDGGSNDKSAEMCLNYQRTYENFVYVQNYQHSENFTKNTGLAIAEGEYVYFIDAFDVLCKTFLNDAVSFLDKNKNIDTFVRNYKESSDNLETFYNVTSYFQQNKIGPLLSACVFRKSAIHTKFEDEICTTIIFSGKMVFLNNNFYYDKDSNSFIKNNNNTVSYTNYCSYFNIDWLKYSQDEIREYIELKNK